MNRRRGFVAILTPIMGILALIAGVALIVGLVSAIGQALMSRLSGSFSSGSFSGSYETTAILDGLPIETSGKIGIEDHMALSAGATDTAKHFSDTNVDGNFSNEKDRKKIKTLYNSLLKSGDTSSFISELGGSLPAEDEAWYVNQRWCYMSSCFKGSAIGTKQQYAKKRVVVTNPKNGRSVVASVLDWGPASWTGRVAGVSPEVATALGLETDSRAIFGWAVDQNVPLGPVNSASTTTITSGPSTEEAGNFSGSGFSVSQELRMRNYFGGSGINTYYARPTYIVLHYLGEDSGGDGGQVMTAREAYNYFLGSVQDSNGNDNKYVQFIIAKDGTIYQLLAETKQSAGACGFNRTPDGVGISISIENEGNFEMSASELQYTQAQVNANVNLIKYLMQKWGIPKSNVVSHQWAYQNYGRGKSCTPKSDPGSPFMNAVKSKL